MENQILILDSLQVSIDSFEKLFIQRTGMTTDQFETDSAIHQRTSILGNYELYKVGDLRLRKYRQGVKMLLSINKKDNN